MGVDPNEVLMSKVDHDPQNTKIEDHGWTHDKYTIDARMREILRENIATQMWHDYTLDN